MHFTVPWTHFLYSVYNLSVYDGKHTALHLMPLCCWIQVRQELVEEYEQVKSIVNTLESFKMDKPVDLPSNQPEEYTRNPDVWPPPTPAEHRYTWRLLCLSITSVTFLMPCVKSMLKMWFCHAGFIPRQTMFMIRSYSLYLIHDLIKFLST